MSRDGWWTVVLMHGRKLSAAAVKFGRMSKKQREKVEDEVRLHSKVDPVHLIESSHSNPSFSSNR